jgi:ferric-dicitrate binding protein FerR (iron transport regulator)
MQKPQKGSFMTRKEAEDLLDRYLAGECSPAEQSIVERAYSVSAEPGSGQIDPSKLAEIKAGLRKNLINRALSGRNNNLRKMFVYTVSGVAALLLVAVGLFRLLEQERQMQADIPPGGNRATLAMASGEVINLNEDKGGVVVKEEGKIIYNDGSALEKEIPATAVSVTASRLKYATLSTPRGGQYQITLSDSTRVWLNAESVLKYPEKFGKKERVVELSGEGFFEVAKNKLKPFKVISRGQEIMVLGTEFNITAYPDEDEIMTTLAEGSVQVTNLSSDTVIRLEPGKQSVVKGADTDVKEVDVSQFTAWKDGKIVLQDKGLKQILNEVSRWYDIDVIYECSVPEGMFFGRANRTGNLSTLLRLLESAGVSYRIEGRKLIITKSV